MNQDFFTTDFSFLGSVAVEQPLTKTRSASKQGKVHEFADCQYTITRSDSSRAKTSQSKKGIRTSLGMTGRRHSAETRALLSQAGRGRGHTNEARQKISAASRQMHLKRQQQGYQHICAMKAVVTPNGVFESISAAAKSHGVGLDCMSRWCKTKIGFYFKDAKWNAK